MYNSEFKYNDEIDAMIEIINHNRTIIIRCCREFDKKIYIDYKLEEAIKQFKNTNRRTL